jgi:hypothetical protein
MSHASVPAPLQLFSLTTGLAFGQVTAALAWGAATSTATTHASALSSATVRVRRRRM